MLSLTCQIRPLWTFSSTTFIDPSTSEKNALKTNFKPLQVFCILRGLSLVLYKIFKNTKLL